MRIRVLPLSSASFGTGKPFSPQMRGPTAHQSSYVVPPPSTIAGALAFLAYKKNPRCAEVDSDEPFASTKNCLRELLGDKFHIRGPFVRVNVNSKEGTILFETYKGLAELPLLGSGSIYERVRKIRECIEKIREGKVKIGHPLKSSVKLNRIRKIGVALDRKSKSVLEGMLYSTERISALQDLEFFVEVRSETEEIGRDVIKFGSDGGIAIFESSSELIFEKLKELWGSKSGGECVLVLTTPLILDMEINVDDPNEWASLEDQIREYVSETLKARESVPGTRVNVEAIPLGWELRGEREYPRPYALAISAGAMFYSTCENWKRTYWEGFGRFKELGYGTVVPLPVLDTY